MDENILVISHRRSGTHLTIDAIRNNFAPLRTQSLMTLETLQRAHPEHISVSDFAVGLEQFPRIVKTHYLPLFRDLLPEPDQQDLVRRLYQDAKKIYVVRNGLDVLVSLYEFRKSHDESVRQLSFAEFIRRPTFDPEHSESNKIQYWYNHVQQWLQSDYAREMLVVSYEDWILNYENTIKKIGVFLGVSADQPLVDVRFGKSACEVGAESTTVQKRKGVIGDFANYFGQQDLELFFSQTEGSMAMQGYELTAPVL